MSVTQTIGQLHFEDLDPIRFEELILSMVYRATRWETINHYGKKGSDDGIDIVAREILENGKERNHHYQCKRYLRLNKSQLTKIIDAYTDSNINRPDKYVLVVSCNLSKDNTEHFINYAKQNGFTAVDIWTNTVIEARLYAEYHDLLFAYFGISLTRQRNNTIAAIRRNISLKHKMKKDFFKPIDEVRKHRDEWLSKPYEKINCNHILVRSIDDKYYPHNEMLEQGHYGFFVARIYKFYHNGVVLFSYSQPITVTIKDYIPGTQLDENDEEPYEPKEVTAYEFGYLPYNNIIDYDCEGDEFYQYPHLFCDYSNGLTPFEYVRFAEPEEDGGYWIYKDEDVLNANYPV